MTDIAKEIERLRGMTREDLIEEYERLFGRPPRCRNREHLWKRCAWKVQEQRLGGLSTVAKTRLEELVSEIDLPRTERQRTISGRLMGRARSEDPAIGTILRREWHGETIEVRVVEDGFEHEGEVYRTLSAAARAITGSRWNGRLFFGLTERRRK